MALSEGGRRYYRHDDAPDEMERPSSSPIPIPEAGERTMALESVTNQLRAGPTPDSARSKTMEKHDVCVAVSDRAELIERLKRGESPTWVPSRRHLLHASATRPPSRGCRPTSRGFRPYTTSPPCPPTVRTLLPAAQITSEQVRGREVDAPVGVEVEVELEGEVEGRMQEGLGIERPPSALHSGDFTVDETKQSVQPCPDADGRQQQNGPGPGHGLSRRGFQDFRALLGSASLSTSLSSSFVYKAPTSPLVQSESNDDMGLSAESLPLHHMDVEASISRGSRRHTLSLGPSCPDANVRLRRDGRCASQYRAHQAHQARPSLSNTPTFSPGTGSLQHASMVGSYEESILRGRMSTTPSKPLDFMAQIGVLGLGKCKASLRCPPHVTLPFAAVFYSYSNTSHGRSAGAEDGPSPYVGQIDLESGLSRPDDEQGRIRRKMQSRHAERMGEETNGDSSGPDGRKAAKAPKRSRSPKDPAGGRYRIPEKGQLQIVIKNQNKTAVKLFLVPYDVTGMEPGTKTFIRQRSYSAGPILDSMPESPEWQDGQASERPVLRYLIHLHICCPSKGRFYLYRTVRVVFANRVPDGKEKLRNELTYPEPRFSPYKQNGRGPQVCSAEQAFRRRSSMWDALDGIAAPGQLGLPSRSFVLSQARPSAMTGTRRTGGDGAVPVAVTVAVAVAVAVAVPKYDKLNRGDVGYGGNAFAAAFSPNACGAEGLLSQRLRGLGVGSLLGPEHEPT